MDKEDCVQALLSTLQKPQWKHSSSVTDWDLKNVLWQAGLLLPPEQAAALLADMRRRGLITSRERRSDNRIVAMWGVKIAPAGVDWLRQRDVAAPCGAHRVRSTSPPSGGVEGMHSGQAPNPEALVEVGSVELAHEPL